jgi:alkanesulfonate monooxygenase SsuD/methylene tetrahydromethanopterin reductase-like flavin-dependent oxidoreductase (luciferase family)
MREYVSVVRALWSGRAVTEGTRWRSQFGFVGFAPRPDIPVYLAALSRGMIRLAAEIADGIVLWACPSSYIRDVVVPEVVAARRAAGRDLADFDVLPPCPRGYRRCPLRCRYSRRSAPLLRRPST